MTGLIGGTFDPPHIGHLVLAEEARTRFGLSRVLFVPAPSPPHKQDDPVTAFEHRLRMTRLAVEGDPFFEAANLEERVGTTEARGASYTVDLLRWFNASVGRPVFIIGMDSLCELDTWKSPHEVLELARVVAGSRPGFDPSGVSPRILEMVELFEIPEVHVSSTELRSRFARGEECRYLTPAPVSEYIAREGIYAC